MIYSKAYIANSNSGEKRNKLFLFDQIGKRLRELRESRGMTLQELGSILGYTAPAIGQKERGERQICACELIRFSKALDLSTAEVLYLIGIKDE